MRNQKNTPATNTNADTNTFTMTGVLESVYDGKSYNYITLRVNTNTTNPKTGQPYYNKFTIAAKPDVELFDDETLVTITGIIKTFYNRTTERSVITLEALSVSNS